MTGGGVCLTACGNTTAPIGVSSLSAGTNEKLSPPRRILIADCWTIADSMGRAEGGVATPDDSAIVSSVPTIVKFYKMGALVDCIVCGTAMAPRDCEIIAIREDGPDLDLNGVRAGICCHEYLEIRSNLRTQVEQEFGGPALIVEPCWEVEGRTRQ